MMREFGRIDKIIKWFAIFFFVYLIYFWGFAFWKIKPLIEENKQIIQKYGNESEFISYCNDPTHKYKEDCIKIAENTKKICFYLILC